MPLVPPNPAEVMVIREVNSFITTLSGNLHGFFNKHNADGAQYRFGASTRSRTVGEAL